MGPRPPGTSSLYDPATPSPRCPNCRPAESPFFSLRNAFHPPRSESLPFPNCISPQEPSMPLPSFPACSEAARIQTARLSPGSAVCPAKKPPLRPHSLAPAPSSASGYRLPTCSSRKRAVTSLQNQDLRERRGQEPTRKQTPGWAEHTRLRTREIMRPSPAPLVARAFSDFQAQVAEIRGRQPRVRAVGIWTF